MPRLRKFSKREYYSFSHCGGPYMSIYVHSIRLISFPSKQTSARILCKRTDAQQPYEINGCILNHKNKYFII